MMKLLQGTLLALMLGLAATAGAEGVQKLGFIDTGRVYQESRQAQAIQQMLDKEFASRQRQLQQLQTEGLRLKEALEGGKVAESEREAQAQKLIAMDQEYRVKSVQLAEDYNLRRNEEFASLQQNANRVIVDLARKEGYDLILQDAIFVNKQFDITDAVIKALNAK